MSLLPNRLFFRLILIGREREKMYIKLQLSIIINMSVVTFYLTNDIDENKSEWNI